MEVSEGGIKANLHWASIADYPSMAIGFVAVKEKNQVNAVYRGMAYGPILIEVSSKIADNIHFWRSILSQYTGPVPQLVKMGIALLG